MSSIARFQLPEVNQAFEEKMCLVPADRIVDIDATKDSRLVFLTDPDGLAAEQYKILSRRLNTAHPHGGVVLMSSPNPGAGKTLTTINLAWSLAETKQLTCIVDLDFRRPSVCTTLGVSLHDAGVEDVLNGKKTVQQSLRQVGTRTLFLLGIKKPMSSPGDLFASGPLQSLLSTLRTQFHWVILDFAPAIPMADAGEVLPHVDGALMVLRCGSTQKSIIPNALEVLGNKLWGTVVNDVRVNGSAYYGSNYKGRS